MGSEGRCIFKCKRQFFLNEKGPMKDLWKAMEGCFIKARNITYDWFIFCSCKQQKGESVLIFYGRLIVPPENFSLVV